VRRAAPCRSVPVTFTLDRKFMDPLDHTLNQTQLVFCRENVDPEFVTRLLGFSPSVALKVGDITTIWGGPETPSQMGIWKLDLPSLTSADTVEEQLAQWVNLLNPKARALADLRAADYAPYIDCKAERGSLSLCVEPELLSALGRLGVSLSIWLYEAN
jgi:hypothetical protein